MKRSVAISLLLMIFGIEPTGFNSFLCAPRLPSGWERMSLNHIKAFKHDFDIDVKRAEKGLKIRISSNGEILKDLGWDGESPLEIILN